MFSSILGFLGLNWAKILPIFIGIAAVLGIGTYLYISVSNKDAKITTLTQQVSVLTSTINQYKLSNQAYQKTIVNLQNNATELNAEIQSINAADYAQQQQFDKEKATILASINATTTAERNSSVPALQQKFISTVNTTVNNAFSSFNTA
jgi:septal ring factor EnvC (AmiA/AmiB activator)